MLIFVVICRILWKCLEDLFFSRKRSSSHRNLSIFVKFYLKNKDGGKKNSMELKHVMLAHPLTEYLDLPF